MKWENLLDIYKGYRKNGVKFIVSGDLFIESSAKLQITLCQTAGLIPCMPLWLLPYKNLLGELEKRKITCIITVINSPLIDSYWLGKVYDRNVHKYFSSIGIDQFGEKGEFHTTVVDADCFRYPLKYHLEYYDKTRVIFWDNCRFVGYVLWILACTQMKERMSMVYEFRKRI